MNEASDTPTTAPVLTVVEQLEAAPSRTSLEALTLARGLADAHGVPCHAVAVAPLADAAREELARHGAAVVHLVDHPELKVDAALPAWAAALAALTAELTPTVVLAPASERSGSLLAHLAARLDLPLATNCTQVVPAADDDGWELTRLRWGGMLLEDAHLEADVALLTVAAHQIVATHAPTPGAGESRVHAPVLDPSLHATRPVAHEAAEGGLTLTTAPVVVSGGRGVGSAEGFALLEELASLLGGAVGCSRVATNAGWRSHADQVGQTGTRIAPDLYIACGISGATQHWVGCMHAKRILAVNTDPEAPMVTRADDAVIGDLHDLLPAVVAEVQARRAR